MGPAALLCVASLVPAVAGSALDNDSIKTAVDLWLSDSAAAEAAYGHISTWDTSGVTDMSYLFCARSGWGSCNTARASFNEDIGDWDTSGVTAMDYMFYKASAFNGDIGDWAVDSVTTMHYMFRDASSFNQDIGGWRVDKVTSMVYMFYEASAFDQDLGWCVDEDVSMSNAFYNTPCASTSCGVKIVEGGCAGWFGSSSQTSNGDGVADKMMTLVVLAALLGLSLAIAAGLFALRQQQQLAAKKPRAPRTFTVTAVQSA